jgi:mRNA-degrading endonuclease toxin of MazEF toxin-antitoxin module
MTEHFEPPIEGQPTLDGGFVPDVQAVDINRKRNSLSRALNFEYLGLKEEDYYAITPDMVEFAGPEQMRPYLLDVPMDADKHPNVVSYTVNRGRKEQTITLTAQEAKLLPRFVGALERNARIGVESKIETDIVRDVDRARMRRSRGHVHEDRLPKVQTYLQTLKEQDALAAAFIQASTGKNAGLSLMGGEARMREKLTYFRTIILGDIIRAYCSERNLTESQQIQVRKAVDLRIAYQGKRNVANFNEYARLAHEILGHKIEATSQRVEAMQKSIGRNLVSTEASF